MARILVTGDAEGIASRTLLERLVEHIRQDGHDAALAVQVQDPAREVRDADAVVAVLDADPHADAAALIAYAHAHRKPALGVVSRGAHLPPFLRAMCTQVTEARKGSEIRDALQAFYIRIRPFAGRLVRDQVPQLVREAGHAVSFRQVPTADLATFLKRKVVEEAQSLDAADAGREREELADLLEALESFIVARGIDREQLREVKARKREQRGGFEKGFVVESASTTAPDQQDGPAAEGRRGPPARTPGMTGRAGMPDPAPSPRAAPPPPAGQAAGWEAQDVIPADRLRPDAPPQAPPSGRREGSVWEV